MSNSKRELSYPRLCALLADRPTKLSQAMHNAGFRHLGLPFVYTAFDTTNTEAALAAMRSLSFRGYSLTIPHKERALPLVDELDEHANKIGAINTIINEGDKLIGYNTDWQGIISAVKDAGASFSGKTVLLIGSGGAARAALYALEQENAARVWIANRSENRAISLKEEFPNTTALLSFVKLRELGFSQFDCVLNATPLGSHLGSSEYPFSFDSLSERHLVFDFVTKDTELTNQARKRGATVVVGTRMLLFQALEQFRLFTGEKAPLEAMERALNEQLI